MVLINLPLATYTLSHPNPWSPFSFLRVTHCFVLVCNKGYKKHFWPLALVISNLFEHFLPFTFKKNNTMCKPSKNNQQYVISLDCFRCSKFTNWKKALKASSVDVYATWQEASLKSRLRSIHIFTLANRRRGLCHTVGPAFPWALGAFRKKLLVQGGWHQPSWMSTDVTESLAAEVESGSVVVTVLPARLSSGHLSSTWARGGGRTRTHLRVQLLSHVWCWILQIC